MVWYLPCVYKHFSGTSERNDLEMTETVGILHPGNMGISVAAAAQAAGSQVYWCSHGRSSATRERASSQGLQECVSLAELVSCCSVIISVCPPHAARQVAEQVGELRFQGVYVDANAIAPQRTREIGNHLTSAGVHYVDGGIVGGPAWQPGTTLWLCGEKADQVADLFTGSLLETRILGIEIGKASALKVCFAAYSKGTTALLSAIQALAETHGIRDELMDQWQVMGPDFAGQAQQRTRRVTAKAWRFEGEMHEIAATFSSANLPAGFHLAAEKIYHRLAEYKDQDMPELEQVLQTLLASANPD